MKRILLIAASAALLTGCSWIADKSKDAPAKPEAETARFERARMEFMKARAEAETAAQMRLQAIQLEVVKRCADKGNIPVLVNGNVDCKVQPK